MKQIIRKIDSANRLRIPKEIMELLGITKGNSMEIFYDNKNLILKKFNNKQIHLK